MAMAKRDNFLNCVNVAKGMFVAISGEYAQVIAE